MSLDFEKPIIKLEEKLTQIKELASKSGKNLDDEAISIEKKINDLKKDIFSKLTRWQKVQLSRHPNRPYFLDYIYKMTDEFIEIHGDRFSKDDKAMVGGFGKVDGKTIMFIGHQKGRNTKERQYRNFGMANPEGYRKALRLMKMAEKFNKPIVCLIDTPGAYPGIEAEERGQAEAIARNIKEMTTLKVPVICIIIGEGASGGALAIGLADKIFCLENTWYSVISPEGCASILFRDTTKAQDAANSMKVSSDDLLEMGIADGIINEPLGGAHNNYIETANIIKSLIIDEVKKLKDLNVEDLISNRMQKYDNIGIYESNE